PEGIAARSALDAINEAGRQVLETPPPRTRTSDELREKIRESMTSPPAFLEGDEMTLKGSAKPTLRVVGEPKPIKKVCGGCQHFSRKLWQDTLKQQPVLAEACKWIGPNQMLVPVATDDDGKALPAEEQPDPDERPGAFAITKDDWACFGGCVKKGGENYKVGMHEDGTCKSWEAVEVEAS
ncbi:MAG: hypothetical protein V3R34_08855, partial [Hyphomicrobium sp.]